MGKRKKSKRHQGTRLEKPFEEETPDPDSYSYYHDEVDEFHFNREKVPLERVKKAKRQDFIDGGIEEVLPVRGSESDEDESEEENQDESDMESDIFDKKTEEDYLPSADAWGRKKRSYYDTDYVDEDYGGFSGSDAEAAEMEEEEALRLQKKMAEQMREEDFFMDFGESAASSSKQNEKEDVDKVDKGLEEKSKNLEELSFEEKVSLAKERCPELGGLTEEYNSKREILVERLEPLAMAVKQGKISTVNAGLRLILMKLDIYSNYLLNIQFYFYLRTKKGLNGSVHNHPVLDKIMSWKKLVDEVENKSEHLEPEVDFLLEKLKNGEDFSDLLAAENNGEARSKQEERKKKKQRKKLEYSRELFGEEEEEEGRMEDEEWPEESGEDEKRMINYEMAKNKGLTPHRKKEQRNPRVKHKNKYRKALIRKRGQIPDMKREVNRYGGEARGIKIGVVKSVKLA